jgi:hypothetical protein
LLEKERRKKADGHGRTRTDRDWHGRTSRTAALLPRALGGQSGRSEAPQVLYQLCSLLEVLCLDGDDVPGGIAGLELLADVSVSSESLAPVEGGAVDVDGGSGSLDDEVGEADWALSFVWGYRDLLLDVQAVLLEEAEEG